MMKQPTPHTKTGFLSAPPSGAVDRSRRAGPGIGYAREHVAGQAGFSLIELIIIIVLIGVLAVMTIPQFDYSSSQLAAVSKKLIADLRYAQGRAVATQISHGIIISCPGGGATNCTQYTVVYPDPDPTLNPANCDHILLVFCPAADPLAGDNPDPVTGVRRGMMTQMTGSYNLVRLGTTLPGQLVCFDKTGTPFSNATCDLVTSAGSRIDDTHNSIDMTAEAVSRRLMITKMTGLVCVVDPATGFCEQGGA
jgi:type II secretory pathway pseudopilin PulG